MYERAKRFRLLAVMALLCASAAGSGCVRTQMQQIAPQLSNMVIARHYLGEPTSSTRQEDGTLLHEWLLDRLLLHPGGVEIVEVYVGHDRDGYRVYREEELYVRPWQERQYCRAQALANPDGRVLRVSWEGPNCDELPRFKLSTY